MAQYLKLHAGNSNAQDWITKKINNQMRSANVIHQKYTNASAET